MSTALLDPRAIDRLAKVCEMFSSPFDGERATAAMRAHEMVTRAGVTWTELLLASRTRPEPAPEQQGPPLWWSWQRRADFCWAYRTCLTTWERGFLESIIKRSGLSEKQQRVLDRIFARVWEVA